MNNNSVEIVIRDCGRVGWLGIVMRGKYELYRTGIHYPQAMNAFYKCCQWMDDNEDVVGAQP